MHLGCSVKVKEIYKNYSDRNVSFMAMVPAQIAQCFGGRNIILKKEKNCLVRGAGSDEIIALLTTGFAGIGDEIILGAWILMYPISAKRVEQKQ